MPAPHLYRPKHQRKARPAPRSVGYWPGDLLGPTFLAPMQIGCCQPNGPRERVRGRWVSAVRASRLRFISRARSFNWPQYGAAARKVWRIAEFLQSDKALPF